MWSKLTRDLPAATDRTVWVAAVLMLIVLLLIAAAPVPRETTLDRERALDAAVENKAYCEKWGLREGTRARFECEADLNELRVRYERWILDEASGFI